LENKAANDLVGVLARIFGKKEYHEELKKILDQTELTKEGEKAIYSLIQDIADTGNKPPQLE